MSICVIQNRYASIKTARKVHPHDNVHNAMSSPQAELEPYLWHQRLACLKMAAPYWRKNEFLFSFLILDKYKVWIQSHITPQVKIKQTAFILFRISSPLQLDITAHLAVKKHTNQNTKHHKLPHLHLYSILTINAFMAPTVGLKRDYP